MPEETIQAQTTEMYLTIDGPNSENFKVGEEVTVTIKGKLRSVSEYQECEWRDGEFVYLPDKKTGITVESLNSPKIVKAGAVGDGNNS